MATDYIALILGPVLSILALEGWQPIKQHALYCVQPQAYMAAMAGAIEDLNHTRAGIVERVRAAEAARRQGPVQARVWLDSADAVEGQAASIEDRFQSRSAFLFGRPWKPISNYEFSRDADEARARAAKVASRAPTNTTFVLQVDDDVAEPLTIPHSVFGQERHITDQVLTYLGNDQITVGIVGIHGAAWIGKTALLRAVYDHFRSAAAAAAPASRSLWSSAASGFRGLRTSAAGSSRK